MSPTSRRFVVLLAATWAFCPASGCTRVGFSGTPTPQVDAAPSPDGPADSSPTSKPDVGPDGPRGKLDEPCEPPSCAPGLVCSGVPGQRYCRPACGGDAGCGDAEACGRLIYDGGGYDGLVPMACLAVSVLERYASCLGKKCSGELRCLVGDVGVCLQTCTGQSDCLASEYCQKASLQTSFCLPRCAGGGSCPGELRCVAVQEAGTDLCAPVTPKEEGELCESGKNCAAQMGCLGTPSRCYRQCPSGTGCKTGEVCLDASKGKYCHQRCDPFAPTACASYELCSVNGADAACLNSAGTTGACGSGQPPCQSGLICVNSACKKLCDGQHPCGAGETCQQLQSGGQNVPWKACI